MAQEKIKIAGIGDVNRSEFIQSITDPDKFKQFASEQGWGNKRRQLAWKSLQDYATGVQNGDINEINDMHQIVDDTGARTNKKEKYNLIGSKFDANGATAYYMNNIAKNMVPKEESLKELPKATDYLMNSWFGGNSPDWAQFQKNDTANKEGVYSITNRTNKLKEGLQNLYNELSTNGTKYNWGQTNREAYLSNLQSAIDNPNNVAAYAPLGINSEFLNNALSTKDFTSSVEPDNATSVEQETPATTPQQNTDQDIINSLSDQERTAYLSMTPEQQAQLISQKKEAISIQNQELLNQQQQQIDAYKKNKYNQDMLNWYKTQKFNSEYSVNLPSTYAGVTANGDKESALRLESLGFTDEDFQMNSPRQVSAIATSTSFKNPNVRTVKTANGYQKIELKNKLDVLAYMLNFQSKHNKNFSKYFTDVSASVGKSAGTIYRINTLKGNDGSYVYVRKNGSNYEFYRSKPMNTLYQEHLTKKHKLGGIITKYQQGGASAYIQSINQRQQKLQKQQQDNQKKKNQQKNDGYVRTISDQDELTAGDIASIASTVADVAASFSGNPIANATTSLLSTGTGIWSDLSHDMSGVDVAKNAAINLGTGVVGLIPGFGIAAKSKKLQKVIKASSKGLMLTFAGIGANDAVNAVKNISSGNFNAQDVKALLYGLSSITHGAQGIRRSYKNSKEATNIVDKTVDKDTKKKVFINNDPKRFYFQQGGNQSQMLTRQEADNITNGSWESLSDELKDKVNGINFSSRWNKPKLREQKINNDWEDYLNNNYSGFWSRSLNTPSKSAIKNEVYSRIPKGQKVQSKHSKSYEWESPYSRYTEPEVQYTQPSESPIWYSPEVTPVQPEPTAIPTAEPIVTGPIIRPIEHSQSWNEGKIVNQVNEYSRVAANATKNAEGALRFSEGEANNIANRLSSATPKSMNQTTIDIYKRVNPALVKDKKSAIEFETKLRQYVANKKKSNTQGFRSNKELKTTLRGIIEHRKFGGTLDDFSLKLYLAKGQSIIKAQQGTKLPWYSGITAYDPSKYTTTYNTSKLWAGDTSKGLLDAYTSNQNGLGISRYAPTQGNTRTTTQGIEGQEYYKNFTSDLLDSNGNFTDVGKAWAQSVDKLLPQNSKASFFDENGNLRTSWTTKNNDVYGRSGKTYNTLSEYVNAVRNDNILGARHNVFAKQGTRYFYKDNDGKQIWVNPEVAKNYNISKNGITSQDGMTTWTDYELTGPTSNTNNSKTTPTIGQKSIFDGVKKYLSDITSNPGNLYNAVETGKYLLSQKANNDIFKIKMPSMAISPKHASYQVMDNLAQQNIYHQQAANTINSSSKPLTSSGQLQAATQQEGMNNANKLHLQGAAERNTWLESQRQQSNKIALYNMENAVDTANTNKDLAYKTRVQNDYIDARDKVRGKATNTQNYINALEEFNIIDPYVERKNAQQQYALAKAQWDYQNDSAMTAASNAYQQAVRRNQNNVNWNAATSPEYKQLQEAQRAATARLYNSMYSTYGIKNPQFKKGGKFEDVSMFNTKEFYNTVRHSINTATKQGGDLNKILLSLIKKNNKK